MQALRLAVATGALVACSAAAAALPAPVTLDGVGGATPGMTVREVSRAWGLALHPRTVNPGCASTAFRRGPLHGYVLFENGRFGAVWFDRGARTPSGITIGSTRAQLVRAYGSRLVFRPHAYQRGAFYVFLRRRRSPHWRIRFDVSKAGRVFQIGFGGRAVAYIEGCA